MKGQLRIDQMYAFIVLDDDGTEGIPAIRGPNGMVLPLVGADMARIDSLREIVRRDPMLKGKRITLAKFSVRENMEVIERDGREQRAAAPRGEPTCTCGTENPSSARHGHSHLAWCAVRTATPEAKP